MWVKVCGITNIEDAGKACDFGADAVGLIFAESPRKISADRAREISGAVPDTVLKVGVFVDSPAGEVREIMEFCGLDYVQLHGSESADYCRGFGGAAIKAVRVGTETDLQSLAEYPCGIILLDGFFKAEFEDGERELFWKEASRLLEKKQIIVAGGLDADNVSEAIRFTRPFGVDAAGGLESAPGIKEAGKIERFINNARKTGQEVNQE